MWSDNETNRDFVNFGCVANTAAEMVALAGEQPLSIGISGGWGVGKSSMLNLIADALSEHNDKNSYIFIRFNAWLYQGYDDARAALMEVIAEKLVTHAAENEPALKKAKELLKRVNWLRVAGLTASSAAALAFGLPPIGLFGAAWSAFKDVTDGDITGDDVAAIEKAGKVLSKAGDGVVKPTQTASPPQQIHELRKLFEESLNEMKATLVVFIDDLDRCLPNTTISTLEAIRLFLFLPRTAFIIAADDKMIRQAVRLHFRDVNLDDDLVTNYFDKLIQIPLRVPPLGTQEVRAYLMLLFIEQSGLAEDSKEAVRKNVCERLSESWKGHRVDLKYVLTLIDDCSDDLKRNLELADRLAPLMTTAKNILGNPRLIKRFLNTMFIRLSVASAQNVVVDEATLAKVLLFERCASEDAYKRLISEVNDGDSGKPVFLVDWEKQAVSGEEIKDLEGPWNTPFVRDWLALQPPLAEADLRAVVYISRETMPIVTAADQMSTGALALLEALLKLSQSTSTLRNSLQELPGRDLGLIAERIIVRARQEQKWGKPSALWAFLALIDASPDQALTFTSFLGSLDPTQLKADIVPILGDQEWAKDILNSWADNPKTSSPVKNAIKNLKKEGS